MASVEIERLIRQLGRLPGLGSRSARRAALAMLKRPDSLLLPLVEAMRQCAERVRTCSVCGNLDTDHTALIELYRAVRAMPGIKHAFVTSGLRYDLFLNSKDKIAAL